MKNNENRVKASHVISQIIFLAIFISAGIGGSMYFIKNKPEVKKKGRKKAKPLFVDVKSFKPAKARIEIDAMGEISPETEVSLKPSVSGEIVKVSKNFYPGGIVKKGEVLIWIDKRDYLYKVQKNQALVQKYKSALEIELGQQKSAAKELEFYEKTGMDSIEDKSLALRKPQLESARADIDSAMADLRQAELNLERTSVKAPFDAIIIETNVNKGSYVSSQETLATIYGTKKYRVKAFVPADRIDLLVNKDKNTDVIVKSMTSEINRKGRLKSVTGKTSQESRMAEVLVEIDDPLGLKTNQKILVSGDYVSITIIAEKLENIISVPREYIHDNKYLWIFNDEKRLEIREIEILWKNKKHILIKSGLLPNEKVIISPISIPVENMPLFINSSDNPLKENRNKRGMKNG